MNDKARIKELLDTLSNSGEEGLSARRYIDQQRVRVNVRLQATGARWTLFHSIALSPRYVNPNEEAYALSLLVHEVHHLKQGMITALSVHGELEAWQIQFRYYKSLTGSYFPRQPHRDTIEELMGLTLWSRSHLRRAVILMRKFAGPKYHVNWLPLYPLTKEIKYWFTRNEIHNIPLQSS